MAIRKISKNGLTLKELERIEVDAHKSKTPESETVLRLAAALREALQDKMSLCAYCSRNAGKLVDKPDSRSATLKR